MRIARIFVPRIFVPRSFYSACCRSPSTAELAIVYHPDGKTYGPLPGDFASDSQVHLTVGLPERGGI